MIAARVPYPYPPDLSALIDRDKVEEGHPDGVGRLLDEWWHLRADHPPVDCADPVNMCRTLRSMWDRPPQMVYLLPHWARYVTAVQQVTGLPTGKGRRGQPFLSAGFVVALIVRDHAALTGTRP